MAQFVLVYLHFPCQVGSCVSDVGIAPSTLTHAGNGVFAKRDFAAGEVVSISPVLLIESTLLDSRRKVNVSSAVEVEDVDEHNVDRAECDEGDEGTSDEEHNDKKSRINYCCGLADATYPEALSIPHKFVDGVCVSQYPEAVEKEVTVNGVQWKQWHDRKTGNWFWHDAARGFSQWADPVAQYMRRLINNSSSVAFVDDSPTFSSFWRFDFDREKVNRGVNDHSVGHGVGHGDGQNDSHGDGHDDVNENRNGDSHGDAHSFTSPQADVQSSILANYCLSKPGSRYAMLPTTLVAMANHRQGARANMVIQWHDSGIKSDGKSGLHSRLAQDPATLHAARFAQLDIQYVATRYIPAG